MLVLSVAYPLFPVSADSAGGAEQILSLLERGIVEAGHKSLVIAAPGSHVAGRLLPGLAAGDDITDEDQRTAQQTHRRLIEQTLQEYPVDVIHYHGLDFSSYAATSEVSAVATLHLPPSWYSPETFSRQDIAWVCVSHSQAASVPPEVEVTVIANGVDPIGPAPEADRKALLWLGRICPEKGPDIALRVAHRLDLPLVIAGPVHGFAFHQQYFRREVEPLLDERRTYAGPVGREQKAALLQQARAVLIPSLAPETSSLVAMEAISAGTPVVAYDSGALPEVVEHGTTGFIVRNETEMAEALLQVDKLTAQPWRHAAETMVKQYMGLYERVMKRRDLLSGTAPQEAL
jgi:glycosyltransferase involved in cell wall biosynthesis